MDPIVATEEDNKALLDFLNTHPIMSPAEIKIDRHQNYFSPYKSQGEGFETYLLKNDEGIIEATATFVFKNTLLNNEIKKIAFLKDLKVSQNRKALISWSNQFLEILNVFILTHKIDYVFSLMSHHEFKNINAFTRPQQMRRPLPRYYLFKDIELVSIHGTYPWLEKPLTTLKVVRGNESLRTQLIEYIIFRNHNKCFLNIWDEKSFQETLDRIPNFSMSNFLIAFDSENKIVGCMSLWSSEKVEDYIPLHYDLRGHNFRQFLKLMDFLSFAKAIPKPFSRTQIEDYFDFSFLNHIYVNNEDIFETLVWYANQWSEKKEFFIYPRPTENVMIRPPKGWITTSSDYHLYLITPPEAEVPAFLHPKNAQLPDIEVLSL